MKNNFEETVFMTISFPCYLTNESGTYAVKLDMDEESKNVNVYVVQCVKYREPNSCGQNEFFYSLKDSPFAARLLKSEILKESNEGHFKNLIEQYKASANKVNV